MDKKDLLERPPVDATTLQAQAEALAAQLEAEGREHYYLGSAPASEQYSLLLCFAGKWDHSIWGPKGHYRFVAADLSLQEVALSVLQAGHGVALLTPEMHPTALLRDHRDIYEGSIYWIESGMRDAESQEKRESLQADKGIMLRAIAEVDAALAQRGLKG